MSPHENFRHTHDDHQPGSAVAVHCDSVDDFDAPGTVGRLAHDHDTGRIYCDDGDEWSACQPGEHEHEHEHDADYAPGRELTGAEAFVLDEFLANASPTLEDTVAATSVVASVLRRIS